MLGFHSSVRPSCTLPAPAIIAVTAYLTELPPPPAAGEEGISFATSSAESGRESGGVSGSTSLKPDVAAEGGKGAEAFDGEGIAL